MNFKKEQLIENAVVRLSKEIQNAAGFQIDIDTLTGIKARVTEQKLPAYAPSDYMPVVVGENAWMETSEILLSNKYRLLKTNRNVQTLTIT